VNRTKSRSLVNVCTSSVNCQTIWSVVLTIRNTKSICQSINYKMFFTRRNVV